MNGQFAEIAPLENMSKVEYLGNLIKIYQNFCCERIYQNSRQLALQFMEIFIFLLIRGSLQAFIFSRTFEDDLNN